MEIVFLKRNLKLTHLSLSLRKIGSWKDVKYYVAYMFSVWNPQPYPFLSV